MLAEHLLGYLYHPVHTAGGLQYSGAGYCCDYDVDYVGRWVAWSEMKTKNEHGKTYAGNGAKG